MFKKSSQFSMHLSPVFAAFLTLATGSAYAVPAPVIQKRAVTPLSASQLSSFAPFTQFARAAYCATSGLQTWSCGGTFVFISSVLSGINIHLEACAANSDFQPTLVGGDGNAIQICE
jgi:hypothetical protein